MSAIVRLVSWGAAVLFSGQAGRQAGLNACVLYRPLCFASEAVMPLDKRADVGSADDREGLNR